MPSTDGTRCAASSNYAAQADKFDGAMHAIKSRYVTLVMGHNGNIACPPSLDQNFTRNRQFIPYTGAAFGQLALTQKFAEGPILTSDILS